MAEYYGGVTKVYADLKIPKSLVTTKGDLIAALGSNNPSRLGIGSDGKVLTAFAAESLGVKWGLVATKFTPTTPATPCWYGGLAGNSSFEAQIDGTPEGSVFYYKNELRESSLPGYTAGTPWGRVRLRNITRNNSSYIIFAEPTSKMIILASSQPTWKDNDVITIGSATCVVTGGYTYSRFFDLYFVAVVPSTAFAAVLEMSNDEKSGASSGRQNSLGCHPYETYNYGKKLTLLASAAYQTNFTEVIVPVVSRTICIALGEEEDINASGSQVQLQVRGYWE